MLSLTPVPLQTAGERALFAELARWDTGGSVRAAVVASLPLTDGPLNRRLSDAVLFVPEGLAVVRIVEVARQSGVVTAVPEGAWTIAPESGPSQVLQLPGGGSTPLDGLMRAGMDVAVRLRQAGLEPGRIARLTILVGEVTGLVPEDGDLGEGDLVARLEPRSLLLGIARASRYSAVGNPRLWATADVRAALEALKLAGRGPSVEELNGEGFPYSPYVLRRPGLMTPAAMAANTAPDGPPQDTQSPDVAPPAVPVPAVPSQAEIADAVAASVASAKTASEAPDATVTSAPAPAPAPQAAPPAAPPPPRQDTVQVDGPQSPPSGDPRDSGGLGGLFAGPAPSSAPPPAAPGTSVFAAQPATPGPMPPIRRPVVPEDDEEDDEPRGRGRTLLLGAVALALVGALAFLAWSMVSGARDDDPTGGPTATGTPTPTGPAVGTVQEVAGVAYTLQAVQVDDTCVGHSYGDTADFFATTDCTGVSRALYSAELDGGPAVVSVSRVRMTDAETARELQALTDRNGSGNISDLLREGIRYTGSPDELNDAEYASALSGSTVTIVESAWVDPDGGGTEADIDLVATNALALETQEIPE